eukprot:CAMPEP_0202979236 /NCGR_PEP_ID=MMETSP1396-20130829/85444_1 /ASSEMBLY_ACC=CAM_ASM_000872 /TAXON_ID= /ORGANISM="Pseudokeronopsis sp., Strain Brazil" /LENGTH=45 /DNA_ID= /DNA_START= /DNA_END= /DNA_ORIENTATION=
MRLDNEEMILRNTYLNSQMGPLVDLSQVNVEDGHGYTLRWTDENN